MSNNPQATHDPTHNPTETIDALRQGRVPDTRLADLVTDHPATRQWIVSRLPQDHKIASHIIGMPGSGKTHLLSLAYQTAVEEGYAVIYAAMDWSKPEGEISNTLLPKLWRSLQGDGLSREHPLLDLYLKAIRNGFTGEPLDKTAYSTHFRNLEFIRVLHDHDAIPPFADMLNAVISADPNCDLKPINRTIKERRPFRKALPPPLKYVIEPLKQPSVRRDEMLGAGETKTTETRKRSRQFLESLIFNAHLAFGAGYKGLVVIFDDWDPLPLSSDGALQRFRLLQDFLCNRIIRREELPYAKQTPIGFVFGVGLSKPDQHVTAVSWEGTDAMEPGKGRCDLAQLSAERIRGLMERIGELYAAAYQVDVTEPPAWGDETLYVRDAVKRCVLLLGSEISTRGGAGWVMGVELLTLPHRLTLLEMP